MNLSDLANSIAHVRRLLFQTAQAVTHYCEGIDRLPPVPMVVGGPQPEPPPSRSAMYGVVATFVVVSLSSIVLSYMRNLCLQHWPKKGAEPIDDTWFNFEVAYALTSVNPVELSTYPAVRKLFESKRALDTSMPTFGWSLAELTAIIDAAKDFVKEFDETVREINRQK